MKGTETMEKRYHYRFHGQVQGVGFRYTAKYNADGLGITGWVRNNYDGTVEMEAQGEEELLDKLIENLRSGRYIKIDKLERTEMEIDDNEYVFREEDDFY